MLLELNQLPNEYISEVPNAQTVYLRVERDNDCFGINSMLLEVLPVPQYNEVPDEILCTDTPGVIDVDLTEYNAQVLGSHVKSIDYIVPSVKQFSFYYFVFKNWNSDIS